MSSIAACLATDPVLSGRLIERANAADQPRYCTTRSVFQAVVSLGVDRTREISLAIATSVYAGSAIKREIFRPWWHHTLACALAASEIARQWGLSPAEPYTAALLHDIGRLGLLAGYPAEYEKIMAGADGQTDDLIGAERMGLGVDHVEAGFWLARQWALPESIVEAIARHHETPTGTLDQVSVVQVACRLADLLGFSVNQSTEIPALDEICAALPEWTSIRLGAQLANIRDAIAGEIGLFEASEAPPSVSPPVIHDQREPEEGPSSWHSGDVPTTVASRSYFDRVMVGALLGAIVVLLSVAAFVHHQVR